MLGHDHDRETNFPELTTMTAVGIVVAVSGNVLISLALNLQKLAHRRLEVEKMERGRQKLGKGQQGHKTTGTANGSASTNGDAGTSNADRPSLDEDAEDRERAHVDSPADVSEGEAGDPYAGGSSPARETQPLLLSRDSERPKKYGIDPGRSNSQDSVPMKTLKKARRSFISGLIPFRKRHGAAQDGVHTGGDGSGETIHTLLPVDVMTEESALDGHKPVKKGKKDSADVEDEFGNESDYLRSKLWCVHSRLASTVL